MPKPLLRSAVQPLTDPLPPCWLRLRPSSPDTTERMGQSIMRVGPNASFRRALAETIDCAQQVVLIASFLFSDDLLADALIRATERGVRVYALTASENRVAALLREEDEFGKRMVKEHKALLNRLAGQIQLRSAEHFHAKFLVADPMGSARGWISTANFNKALEQSVELGVALSPESARTLAKWFSWAFWKEAERELASKGRLAKVAPPPAEPARPSTSDIVVTARGVTSLRSAALRLIKGARSELFVSSYGFGADHALVRAIAERAQRGVEVTVFTRPRPAVAEAVAVLASAGVTVLAHDKLHAKAIWTESAAMVLTANLSAEGMDHGFEVGVLLGESGQEELRCTFVDWWNQFPWKYAQGMKRTEHLGEICLVDEGLRSGIRQVVETREIRLSPVLAGCALELAGAPQPTLKAPRGDGSYPREIRFEWEVLPPRLPKNAKELKRVVERTVPGKDGKPSSIQDRQSYTPRAYALSSKKYVVLEDDSQTRAARALAKELGGVVVVR